MLDRVTRAVVQAAEEIGRKQHPTIRGTLEGDVVWPIFRRGAHYAAAFPDWAAMVLLRLAGDAGPTSSAVTPALHRIRRHPPAVGAAVLSDG